MFFKPFLKSLNKIFSLFLNPIHSYPTHPSPKTIRSVLFSICALFIFNFLVRLNTFNDPFYDDYLHVKFALELQQDGGIFYFLKNFFSFDLYNSHFYTLIYSFLVEPSFHFFNKVRYFNLFSGLIMIFSVYYVGKKIFNPSIALLASFLLSINPVILERLTFFAPEHLLIIFSYFSFLFLILALTKKIALFFVFALLLSLLIPLVKINGLFVLASFIAFFLFLAFEKLKKIQSQFQISYSYFYLSIFLFFCISLSLVYFLDYEKLYKIATLDRFFDLTLKSIPLDTTEWIRPSYPAYYSIYADHLTNPSWLEQFLLICKKIIWGFSKELKHYSVSVFASLEFFYRDIISFNTGWLIFPLLIALILKDPVKERRIFFLFYVVITFLASVPRASINHGTARYSIAAAPIAYFYLAPFFFNLFFALKHKFPSFSLKKLIAAFSFFFLFLNFYLFPTPFKSFSFWPSFSSEYQMSLDWIKDHAPESVVLIHEPNSKLRYSWYTKEMNNFKVLLPSTIHQTDIPIQNLIRRFQFYKTQYLEDFPPVPVYIIVDLWATSPYSWIKSKSRFFFRQEILNILKTQQFTKLLSLNPQLKLIYPPVLPPKRILIYELQ